MKILDILTPDAVKVPLEATDKRAVIRELVDLLADAGLVPDADELERIVWERERQRSTGIGEGLAIPHGKSAATDRLLMAIGRPAGPIEFESFDGQPVRLVVLLVSPPDRTSDHIQALSRISRVMADGTFRNKVYKAESREALIELLESADA